MSIIFSAITFLDSNTDFEFIVGGNALTKPSVLHEIKELIVNTDGTERFINIKVYKYGSGKHEDASPQSLKCINMLRQVITDFLEIRCQLLVEVMIKIPTKNTNNNGCKDKRESCTVRKACENVLSAVVFIVHIRVCDFPLCGAKIKVTVRVFFHYFTRGH